MKGKGKMNGPSAAKAINNTARWPRTSTAQLQKAVAKTGSGSSRNPSRQRGDKPMQTDLGGSGTGNVHGLS